MVAIKTCSRVGHGPGVIHGIFTNYFVIYHKEEMKTNKEKR